jgi:hypothetical protein
MIPKWLTIYLANWPTAFSSINNPSAFEMLYLLKYFGGFRYFISHDMKNQFKNAVTLGAHVIICVTIGVCFPWRAI